jgi:acetyl esterase/lipase
MRYHKILIVGLLSTISLISSASDFNVPSTISPQAQKELSTFTIAARDHASTPPINDIAAWKKWQQSAPDQKIVNQLLKFYQPKLQNRQIAGVAVLDVYPRGWHENKQLIIYLHGGAYTFGSAQGSLVASVPVANDSGLHVLAIDYDLAPEHQWPSAQNQVIAVYQALLKQGYKPRNIAFLGDSAGGSLVLSSLLKMQASKIPLPAAAVTWSPWADLNESGDSYKTLKHAETAFTYPKQLKNCARAYAPESAWRNPYISPVYGKYDAQFTPTLIQGGVKEIFLSDFVRLYQNMDQSGATVKLDLYEGMWHVFQADYTLPEAVVARKKTVGFIKQHLHPAA